MSEDISPYGNAYFRRIEDSDVLYCPYCNKSLIEYSGKIFGMRVMCPGCNHIIVSWGAEVALKNTGSQIAIQKIISGGQTGADRAGLDAAIELDIPYGGWLPKGRKAEDGIVPEKYLAMQELTRGGYPKRTEQNVVDSDGTVIFSYGKPVTGSALTVKLAKKHQKPFLYVDLGLEQDHVALIVDWLIEWDIKILNVAGSRESKAPGIYERVKGVLIKTFE